MRSEKHLSNLREVSVHAGELVFYTTLDQTKHSRARHHLYARYGNVTWTSNTVNPLIFSVKTLPCTNYWRGFTYVRERSYMQMIY